MHLGESLPRPSVVGADRAGFKNRRGLAVMHLEIPYLRPMQPAFAQKSFLTIIGCSLLTYSGVFESLYAK